MTSTLYNNIKRLVTKYFEDKDVEDVTLPQWFEDNFFHLNGKIYVEENPFDRVPLGFTFEGTELTQYSGGSFDGEDMIIDYGDGTIERTGGRFGHTYSENGTYQVKIYGVTILNRYCFRDCTGLTSITIPNGVTSFGMFCFEGCTGLTSITIPNSVTSFGLSCFNRCTGLTSITIPNSITSLGSNCFQNCTGLTSITIPDTVTSLGVSCFRDCASLASITIPDTLTSLGASCFRDCDSLTSITIPNSITSLKQYCFQNCNGLTSIIIPNGITSIGNYCFRRCTSLNDYYLNWTSSSTIITYDSNKMPNNTNTIFHIPEGTISLYENKGYPSDKLVEDN